MNDTEIDNLNVTNNANNNKPKRKRTRKSKIEDVNIEKIKVKEVKSVENIEEIKPVEEVKVKKKRGRKKKIKTEEELERERNRPKQRRGRKPKSLVNINNKNSEYLLKKSNKEETIILNLKINKSDNDFEKNKNESNLDNIPSGFNTETINNFSSLPFNIDNNIDSNIDNIDNIDNNIKSNNDILIDNEKNEENKYNLEEHIIYEKKKWLTSTNIACYWCCHTFKNAPFGIPIKYKNDKFYVSGYFCSLECAAAYNFSEEKNIQDIWESYNLLNLLSQKINYKNIIRLAPKRICLNTFGGNLNIDEFRKFTDHNKIVNILEYPMISASQQIEEINYDNSYNKNNYIPIDEERIKKLEQKIKLMRTTPLLNHKNTLEHTMNIKITN